ncbi:MAG: hypothetical protein ACRDY0_06570 [Acidimicrobiales bacterium]
MAEPSASEKVLAAKLVQQATRLEGEVDRAAAAAELVSLCEGRRPALEEARDICARRLHDDPGDWEATAALGLLNRSLAAFGWVDRYGWKGRRRP